MFEGVLIRAYGGFYYVQKGAEIWQCTLRGKFRLAKGAAALVGDRVRVTPVRGNTGRIDEVLPRKTELFRPPVANIDQAVIVFAVQDPEPNLALLDRFLVLAEHAGVAPVVCLNKADLLSGRRDHEWLRLYRKIGYPTVITSTQNNEGIDDLRQLLAGKTSVLAGPSGVGKSSLLNAVQPGLQLKTGEISYKLRRGKHTTRHVELLPLTNGGFVADTPGFSSLDLPDMEREELGYCFPEFAACAAECKFKGCLHCHEPHCAVKTAVAQGLINQTRYQHYLMFLEEVLQQERRY
ncbi:ribosome small subunit-dependent GTPase A [Desulforamulus hydrothermalis]|uniref:Small ribosomal subunit biogenesis GTPase RsgA n=1 Tax=Desulforamulus hydrothermalis Lam5 = DSM 18033 TaxID=1121428 RepID=K8DXE4_9FIRM|nr:ribosome small subunit-dependent GTPase A [Desulforamulus hydrothermalis]CCO07175.1 ribosome small subunit-dependent GTPase A [Desulforamulus hydrothermalis Lam5 = DSM 18033]SHG88474.1 ribosome biogenesis GTPase [Desulforamulus hydrothermalis Lam5 = DSM 18033]